MEVGVIGQYFDGDTAVGETRGVQRSTATRRYIEDGRLTDDATCAIYVHLVL